MITSERVRQARELKQFTQAELARRIEVPQGTIAHIETGRFEPSDDLIERIAFQTGFPPAFFRLENRESFPLGSLLFRAAKSMTARDRDSAYRLGQIMYELSEQLAARTNKIQVRLPNLDTDPIEAARITRSQLNLEPDTPIPNLTQAVERAGVLALTLPMPIIRGDAYSVWAGNDTRKPVIVMSSGAPGDRLRFTMAHEIGHLVLHQAPRKPVVELDKEADAFAAELLMPEVAMRQELLAPVTLSGLVQLKPRWRVSIQALVRRCLDLNLITKRQYTYLFEQISMRGWRIREPEALDVPLEKPRLIRQMAEMLYGSANGSIAYDRLAADTSLSASLVRQIIEAHAGKSGGSSSASKSKPQTKVLPFDKKHG